ncbi:hyaluronate lyase [Pedobacter sp. KBW06]|uniref:Gfo/Idh/MocA family protein n=1 Tax=Pedobacter sp. KBW06 TaxID=2153359 RepID=UPI000F5A109F|nr:Gfo/Idh/MocA family oxidoreductase [Pedobacter sp. KBW06]RQO66276.1 hyaluronate lyase [Pedobacter sp. KBW06]
MFRREFIQNTGILAGGLLLPKDMFGRTAAGDQEGRIKVAVIGCGDRGKGLLHIAAQLPAEFEVAAICDVLDFRLKETLKQQPGLKQYQDYRALLDDKTIRAVFISTPLNMHFPIAVAALQAGKHVYLEKTMTYNITEALDLVKIVKQHPDQILQVGHQYRYAPIYYKVKEMIDKGYLGKVTQIDSRWDRNNNWRRSVPEPSLERKINWRMYKEYSGGLMAELLSHQMDFINWAFDTHPQEIFATGGIDFYKDGRETYDNVQVMFRYAKEGMIGNFGTTLANERDSYLFKLKGTKGTISLLVNDAIFYPEKSNRKELETVDGVTGATKIVWDKDGGIPIRTDLPGKDGTYYSLKDFHRAIAEKKQPDSNVITGARTAICVHLANKALYEERIEKWDSKYNV